MFVDLHRLSRATNLSGHMFPERLVHRPPYFVQQKKLYVLLKIDVSAPTQASLIRGSVQWGPVSRRSTSYSAGDTDPVYNSCRIAASQYVDTLHSNLDMLPKRFWRNNNDMLPFLGKIGQIGAHVWKCMWYLVNRGGKQTNGTLKETYTCCLILFTKCLQVLWKDRARLGRTLDLEYVKPQKGTEYVTGACFPSFWRFQNLVVGDGLRNAEGLHH